MGVFESKRTFPLVATDYAAVAKDVGDHFRRQGFEVKDDRRMTGDYDISITKGGLFKTVCGLRTALKIQIENRADQTCARAAVGIFGQQAIPTVISMLFFWPVLLTQIWGMIEQAKLDDEALRVVEQSIKKHGTKAPTSTDVPSGGAPAAAAGPKFCAFCGKPLPEGGRFCPECGREAV